MKVIPLVPPREFTVGQARDVTLRDCARIELAPDEQVTFVTDRGSEYDVTRKDWGFYATPSLNGRLAAFGLKGVVVRNREARLFVLLVEESRISLFDQYVEHEQLTIVAWLDAGEWPGPK